MLFRSKSSRHQAIPLPRAPRLPRDSKTHRDTSTREVRSLTDGVTSNISFDREGLALGLLTTMSGNGGAVLALHDATNNATRTRCLEVTNVGNVSVQQPSTLSTCS